jgi:5-methylcytosine-specific restriction enzyme A
MKLKDLTERPAVEKALAEFERIGREAFLAKYEFGPARKYFVESDGKRYDSKAIAGVALGYQFPEQGPLSGKRFSGGEHTVAAKLRVLGFRVVDTSGSQWYGKSPKDLKRGDELSNADLGVIFGVGNNGGMRRSRSTNTLVIVSDPTKGLYIDEWRGGILHYCGMGLQGAQSLSFAQNKTLAESRTNGVAVHLFEVHHSGIYEYVGPVQLVADPYESQQPDKNGNMRRVWVFPVRPIDGGGAPALPSATLQQVRDRQRREARHLTADELAKRARGKKGKPASRTVTATAFVRDEYVAEYARRRAAGKCELCGQKAPFKDKNRDPYLESHHVVWLARGGEDSIENTVALCPNCHRRMHILDRADDVDRLRRVSHLEFARAKRQA